MSALPPGIPSANVALFEAAHARIYPALLAGPAKTKEDWLAVFTNPSGLIWERHATTVFPTPSSIVVLAPAPPRALDVVVINEIMQNPSSDPDQNGEWFELFNPTGEAIDINGWSISDDGTDSHVINNGSPLLLAASGYLVLGSNGNHALNGGADLDYVYGLDVILDDDLDELILRDALGREVDRVAWDDGATFPDPSNASMMLLAPVLDNNVDSNWTTSTSAFGSGGRGTPGLANTESDGNVTIPEPVTCGLFTIAGLALLCQRRRPRVFI